MIGLEIRYEISTMEDAKFNWYQVTPSLIDTKWRQV